MVRKFLRETVLTKEDFILPMFVVPGKGREEPIPSLPGVFRMSVDKLRKWSAGLESSSVLIFGVADENDKDETGATATDPNGLVPQAIREIKASREDLMVITDVCLCGYMSHGHCGLLTDRDEVDNDKTLKLSAAMATAHAQAGADIVAPSGMMDGQVLAIRERLESDGFHHVAIMAYASKFASCFYGPFRDAAHSAPSFGDRKSYQLQPGNQREAIREALLDEDEGADWLMVKPAMPYLDILALLRERTSLPLSAYQVSGEYAMLKQGAQAGLFDEREAVLESLTCIKRAGADAIITYYCEEVCRWLKSAR